MHAWRWLSSPIARQLCEACRLLQRMENEQRDLLAPQAIAALDAARTRALDRARIGSNAELISELQTLTAAAGQWLKPYPHAAARENIKEILVALVSILAFTTFFLQLSKIPTGSMQPSLYGITYENLLKDPTAPMPGRLQRFVERWLWGVSYVELIAPFDGYVRKIGPEKTVLPFVKRQSILFGRSQEPAATLHVWFPPDERWPEASGLSGDHLYRAGEPIIKLRSRTGDRVLIDRLTYNFRRPERGEVIVFKTKGIKALPNDVLYIKRLVGLPGEEIRIGNDQHLVINGKRLDAADPGFENVYTIKSPGESHYSGHVNQEVAQNKFHLFYQIAPLFPDEKISYVVPPAEYLVMGDNTLNSLDSRSWGSFPEQNIVGRCWFVYWPFTRRFGWKTW
jgi:signal peptidase I